MKDAVINTYNEVEEIQTSLKELTDEELVALRNNLIERTSKVLDLLDEFVSDEDILKLQ